MSEKRKAEDDVSVVEDAGDKKAKNIKTTVAAEKATGEKNSTKYTIDNIEEDDEFLEFEVYSTYIWMFHWLVVFYWFMLVICCTDWDIRQARDPNTLDFQDNWDEDASDKSFVAQLRKELGK